MRNKSMMITLALVAVIGAFGSAARGESISDQKARAEIQKMKSQIGEWKPKVEDLEKKAKNLKGAAIGTSVAGGALLITGGALTGVNKQMQTKIDKKTEELANAAEGAKDFYAKNCTDNAGENCAKLKALLKL